MRKELCEPWRAHDAANLVALPVVVLLTFFALLDARWQPALAHFFGAYIVLDGAWSKRATLKPYIGA